MRKNLIKAHILSQNKPELLQGHHDGQEHRPPLSRQHPKKPCPHTQPSHLPNAPRTDLPREALFQKPPHTSSALLLMRTKCSLSETLFNILRV
ncbi:hypothetical protein BH14330 [Bartonella henselae str. Houston-1]|uniref:Uncharacterized protein n=2 Tax=root TaxID=1 RepID=A0A0H3LZM9_BARHE|nr:hypothetical protein BH14330 [Bartonella henselae str. Houston-1]DBA12279.1 TPA_asm: hypothetical protein [Bartonegtaviriform andersoni]